MSNEVYYMSVLGFAVFFVKAYQITDIVRYFKFTISTCALCMNDALWNTFAIEVGQQINQMEVLQ